MPLTWGKVEGQHRPPWSPPGPGVSQAWLCVTGSPCLSGQGASQAPLWPGDTSPQPWEGLQGMQRTGSVKGLQPSSPGGRRPRDQPGTGSRGHSQGFQGSM